MIGTLLLLSRLSDCYGAAVFFLWVESGWLPLPSQCSSSFFSFRYRIGLLIGWRLDCGWRRPKRPTCFSPLLVRRRCKPELFFNCGESPSKWRRNAVVSDRAGFCLLRASSQLICSSQDHGLVCY